MAASLPHQTVDELQTEAMLGRYRIVVVEGPRDVTYLNQWLQEMDVSLGVVSVDGVESSHLYPGTGEFGNRDRVIALARANPELPDVRFVADLDLDENPPDGPPSLMWTDFPSIESYAIAPRILGRLLALANRLPAASPDPSSQHELNRDSIDRLVGALGAILIPLYFIRRAHRAARCVIGVPTELRKFVAGGKANPPTLDTDKIVNHLGLSSPEVPDCKTATIDQVRRRADGHDIARA